LLALDKQQQQQRARDEQQTKKRRSEVALVWLVWVFRVVAKLREIILAGV